MMSKLQWLTSETISVKICQYDAYEGKNKK